MLNRDVKQFGKKYMFDGNQETCWNSDQGSSQFVMVELPHSSSVGRLEVKFQGGFAAKEGELMGGEDLSAMKMVQKFYPADDNSLQVSFVGSNFLRSIAIELEGIW